MNHDPLPSGMIIYQRPKTDWVYFWAMGSTQLLVPEYQYAKIITKLHPKTNKNKIFIFEIVHYTFFCLKLLLITHIFAV